MIDNSITRNKYGDHRRNSRRRGIPFPITYQEWFDIWDKSGKWDLRGVVKGSYVMSRNGDAGAYEIGNVSIKLRADNNKEAHIGRVKSPEECNNIRLSHLGHVVTEETRKRISAALKEKANGR